MTPQPGGSQIDWALTLAVHNLLTGSHGRPANFDHMGLGSYSPSSDYPTPALAQPSGSSGYVPPQVLEGIFAAESNWDQASYHAARGVAGNPLIADYYGARTTGGTIDYSKADCGYGIGQITDGMQAQPGQAATPLQIKVAVDYAENIAAASSKLAAKWNQLYSAGITLNNADPSVIENWYFAIWAYNTGVNPQSVTGNTTGCAPSPMCSDPEGNWGLGWTNNPLNASFPPNRHEFNTQTGDASNPWQWPYQEQVLGWIDDPLAENAQPLYPAGTKSGQYLSLPPAASFCDASDHCTPNPPAGQDNCQLATATADQYHCWWNKHVTYTDCTVATNCHTEASNNYDAASNEPTVSNPYPPACTLTSDVPSPLSSDARVVDDEALSSQGGTSNTGPGTIDYNLAGCTTAPSGWESDGTMAVSYGTDANGAQTVQIDFHQLGVGFGGHTWFTHIYPFGDTAHAVSVTWTPSLAPGKRAYHVKVFVPNDGATDPQTPYAINDGSGNVKTASIDQGAYNNQWADLGTYDLQAGATVSAANLHRNSGQAGADVAFDAVAFVPEDLTYEGGVALAPASQLFMIGWMPGAVTNSSGGVDPYVTGLEQFGLDLGQTPLFKNVLPQYYWNQAGTLTHIAAGQPFMVGRMWIDTRLYPAATSCGQLCLDDGTIADEVRRAIAANSGWQYQTGNIYIVYTGAGVTVCSAGGVGGLGSQCSGRPGQPGPLCAYHWFTNDSVPGHIVYGAVPYPGTSGCTEPSGASHDPVLDGAVSKTAHETAEAMTDPLSGAWCRESGWTPGIQKCTGESEIADKCDGLMHTQQVAGRSYVLHDLYSNQRHGCDSGT